MRAAVIVNGRLEVREEPDPIPGVGEVLVQVSAAGLNNADRLQIAGLYPAPAGSPQHIPGLEFAGVVVAVGPSATRVAVGDRVMAVVGGGALAERIAVHERLVMPVPQGMSDAAAGGFPEAFTTAHDALVTQCDLRSGDHVCVHGAAGGVGIAAVQIAVAMGARVTATVRSADLRWAVTGVMGETWSDQINAVQPEAFSHHGPFDIILELVGASNLSENISALNIGGRISVIGVGGGGSRGEIDLLALMGKRGAIRGSTLRARPLEQKADAARRVESQLLPHVESGRIGVPVQQVFGLSEVNAAYERFATGAKFGKIVVDCRS